MVISMLVKADTLAKETRQGKEICVMVKVFKGSLVFALVAPSLLYQSLTSACIYSR